MPRAASAERTGARPAAAARGARAAQRSAVGRLAEDMAAAELERRGAEVLMRNFRRRTGELDLVALERGTLVIVEVRLRSRDDYGSAAASVDPRKQARIVRTARQLLQLEPALARLPVRFDVAVVSPDAAGGQGNWVLEWIPQAFDAGAC